MSRPRYDWHHHAANQLRKYPKKLCEEGTEQSKIWIDAIEKTIKETEEKEDGDLIMKAVEMRYFKNTHTITGIAMTLNICERKVQEYTNAFVRNAGKKAGY